MALLNAFIDPEFLGCLVVYGGMFLGAYIFGKIADRKTTK